MGSWERGLNYRSSFLLLSKKRLFTKPLIEKKEIEQTKNYLQGRAYTRPNFQLSYVNLEQILNILKQSVRFQKNQFIISFEKSKLFRKITCWNTNDHSIYPIEAWIGKSSTSFNKSITKNEKNLNWSSNKMLKSYKKKRAFSKQQGIKFNDSIIFFLARYNYPFKYVSFKTFFKKPTIILNAAHWFNHNCLSINKQLPYQFLRLEFYQELFKIYTNFITNEIIFNSSNQPKIKTIFNKVAGTIFIDCTFFSKLSLSKSFDKGERQSMKKVSSNQTIPLNDQKSFSFMKRSRFKKFKENSSQNFWSLPINKLVRQLKNQTSKKTKNTLIKNRTTRK